MYVRPIGTRQLTSGWEPRHWWRSNVSQGQRSLCIKRVRVKYIRYFSRNDIDIQKKVWNLSEWTRRLTCLWKCGPIRVWKSCACVNLRRSQLMLGVRLRGSTRVVGLKSFWLRVYIRHTHALSLSRLCGYSTRTG